MRNCGGSALIPTRGDWGSDDVSRDAWADWDTGKQEGVLRCAFDYAHCHKCDGETSIKEVDLALASF